MGKCFIHDLLEKVFMQRYFNSLCDVGIVSFNDHYLFLFQSVSKQQAYQVFLIFVNCSFPCTQLVSFKSTLFNYYIHTCLWKQTGKPISNYGWREKVQHSEIYHSMTPVGKETNIVKACDQPTCPGMDLVCRLAMSTTVH